MLRAMLAHLLQMGAEQVDLECLEDKTGETPSTRRRLRGSGPRPTVGSPPPPPPLPPPPPPPTPFSFKPNTREVPLSLFQGISRKLHEYEYDLAVQQAFTCLLLIGSDRSVSASHRLKACVNARKAQSSVCSQYSVGSQPLQTNRTTAVTFVRLPVAKAGSCLLRAKPYSPWDFV